MLTLKIKKCKRVHGLHFTPAGNLLAVGASVVEVVESAVLLDITTGQVTGRIELDADRYAVPPDVSRLAALKAYQDEEGVPPVQWATLPDGDWHAVKGFENLTPGNGDLHGIAFDASGERLAVGHNAEDDGNELTVLRLDSNTLVGKRAFAEYPGVLAFNAGADRLAVSGGPEGGSPGVRVFSLPTLEPLFGYEPPGTRTRSLLFLTDGRLVAANARNVYLFPPGGGDPQFVLGGHKGQVNAVAASPHNGTLLTAGHDGAIRVWNAATGTELRAFDWKVGPVTAVALSPDGLTAAAAGDKGRVVVWDVDE